MQWVLIGLMGSVSACSLITGPSVRLDFRVLAQRTGGRVDSVAVTPGIGEITVHGFILVFDCTRTTGEADRDEDTITLRLINRPENVRFCTLGNHADEYDARLFDLAPGRVTLVVEYKRGELVEAVHTQTVTVE